MLAGLGIPPGDGGGVPLSQVARLEPAFEDGIIWHRDRLPTVTVRADIADYMLPPAVTQQILPTLDDIRTCSCLPAIALEVGGTVEDSARGQNSINAGMPLFLLVVITLLMLQLRGFSPTAIAGDHTLGIIGATLFLLLFQMPLRLRHLARHDRTGGRDHAQLSNPGGPDPA